MKKAILTDTNSVNRKEVTETFPFDFSPQSGLRTCVSAFCFTGLLSCFPIPIKNRQTRSFALLAAPRNAPLLSVPTVRPPRAVTAGPRQSRDLGTARPLKCWPLTIAHLSVARRLQRALCHTFSVLTAHSFLLLLCRKGATRLRDGARAVLLAVWRKATLQSTPGGPSASLGGGRS